MRLSIKYVSILRPFFTFLPLSRFVPFLLTSPPKKYVTPWAACSPSLYILLPFAKEIRFSRKDFFVCLQKQIYATKVVWKPPPFSLELDVHTLWTSPDIHCNISIVRIIVFLKIIKSLQVIYHRLNRPDSGHFQPNSESNLIMPYVFLIMPRKIIFYSSPRSIIWTLAIQRIFIWRPSI